MDSVSPVLTHAEVPAEQVIALDQPQFFPIVIARIDYIDGSQAGGGIPYTLCRFRLTEDERVLIAAGADLLIGQPGHGQWVPISLQLAMPDKYPSGV
jgi:hypothetical protein